MSIGLFLIYWCWGMPNLEREIDCDVHGREDFDELRYGVMTAQRGWLPKSQCLNCMDAKALDAWRRQKRG